MPRLKDNTAGFTLLEMLIAIAVFAVLAMMAYGTLSNVLSFQTQTQDASERLNRMQRAILYLERDIYQIVDRSVRNDFGTRINSLLSDEIGVRLEFTRTGRPNRNIAPRSYLQRISYVMPTDEENKLYRYVWPVLDRGMEQEPHKQLLLDDVEELTIQFYGNNEEHLSWPPPQAQGTNVMPRGIKVILKTKSMGQIWRLFVIPGA